MKIAIGCDPNAEEAKKEIIAYIEKKGYGEVTDFGSEDPVYANVAIDVAEHVASGEYDRGSIHDRRKSTGDACGRFLHERVRSGMLFSA